MDRVCMCTQKYCKRLMETCCTDLCNKSALIWYSQSFFIFCFFLFFLFIRIPFFVNILNKIYHKWSWHICCTSNKRVANMSKNKNKNTQEYTGSKAENETANEDKELIKYLYDKEIERSKLIVEKTTVAFFLFAVDSGFLAINWKELFVLNEVSQPSRFAFSITLLCIIVSAEYSA